VVGVLGFRVLVGGQTCFWPEAVAQLTAPQMTSDPLYSLSRGELYSIFSRSSPAAPALNTTTCSRTPAPGFMQRYIGIKIAKRDYGESGSGSGSQLSYFIIFFTLFFFVPASAFGPARTLYYVKT